jgi:ribosome-associated translation inhibitor RaiA
MSERQFTTEELDTMLEGWFDKLEKKRQAALEKRASNDPMIQYLDKKIAKLDKILKKNKDRIDQEYGGNSEYRRHLRNFRNF